MADSDDEYDRKRRDKFRGERSSGEAFRTERRDDRRPIGGAGGGGGRDEWSDRNPFRGGTGPSGGGAGGGRPRPDYRDFRGPRDRYGSPGREMPPAKRMRGDWGDDMRGNPRFGGYDPYLMQAWNEHYAHSLHSAYAHASHAPMPRETNAGIGGGGVGGGGADTQTQPAMMTLKQFLDTQDDGISDSEVLRKYTEYKTEFKRQQLNEFFVAHKDEEWFKHKYHPEESVKRKEEQKNFLKKRTDVFNELLGSGTINNVKVDSNQSDALVRLLDTVVIKLEGGTDEDLKVLDEKPKEFVYHNSERKSESERTKTQEKDDDVIITSVENKKKSDDEVSPAVLSPHAKQRRKSNETNWNDEDDSQSKTPASPKETTDFTTKSQRKKAKKKKTRKRASSDSSASSASDSETTSSSSESEEDDDEDDEQVKKKYDLEAETATTPAATEEVKKEEASETIENDVEKNNGVEIKSEIDVNADSKGSEEEHVESKNQTVEDAEMKDLSAVNEEKMDIKSPKSEEGEEKDQTETGGDSEAKTNEDEKPAEAQPETIDLDKVKDGPHPRALHRTSSIFLRNLAPAITKAEIEAICQRFKGYLRVAIADPLVERRWFRRGWITFERDVNIKEICWNLNNLRLRDCEMGAIVNRDLSRRVRPANGITAHKTIVRADIKLCAKIAMNLDERFKLWSTIDASERNEAGAGDNAGGDDANEKSNGDGGGAATSSGSCYGFKTNNPVLQNITDFLIEEASAEEEELLGISGETKDGDGEALERDEALIAVLDRLVLYLRIVHSVDYYNHCEYPYEDEMPNRCGIIHARGPPPSKTTANDVQDYIKAFESKLTQFLTKVQPLNDEDIQNLGAKDSETEVEKFIQANTQELAKDKWLCPLSGKKFKGPEFIRKHIFNKHMEKVDEVKKEVEFFNNYLRDPKRPQLPEHPGSNKRTNSESSNTGSGGYRPPMYPPAFPAAPYGFGPMMMGGRGRGGFGGGGGGGGGAGGGGGRRLGGHDNYRPRSHYRDLDAPQEPY